MTIEEIEKVIDDVSKKNLSIVASMGAIEFLTGSKDAADLYFRRAMFQCDLTSERNYVRRQGLEEGMAKGIAEGHAEEKIEIARNLKRWGYQFHK